uniref:Nicotinamide-nucleotide adenylyltransferase n=1 Tax=Panagrellus redivivus TaxID=6233 RepID=A0A7E4ZTX0_PANRE
MSNASRWTMKPMGMDFGHLPRRSEGVDVVFGKRVDREERQQRSGGERPPTLYCSQYARPNERKRLRKTTRQARPTHACRCSFHVIKNSMCVRLIDTHKPFVLVFLDPGELMSPSTKRKKFALLAIYDIVSRTRHTTPKSRKKFTPTNMQLPETELTAAETDLNVIAYSRSLYMVQNRGKSSFVYRFRRRQPPKQSEKKTAEMSFHNARVALLACGSFNPPTALHFRMMEVAKDYLERECNSTVVEAIMSPVADTFGKKGLAPAQHRFAMLDAATTNIAWLRADSWECSQTKWTRTLAVLQHHEDQVREKYQDSKIRVVLVCGGDVVDSFVRILPDGSNLWSPLDVQKIINDFGVIVIDRTDATPHKTLCTVCGDKPVPSNNVAIVIDEAFPNGISSTRLRSAIQAGKSIRFCTLDPVVDYILANKLYV